MLIICLELRFYRRKLSSETRSVLYVGNIMDEDTHPNLQVLSENPMDADEGPLINENSNGLSHLLTENEINSVDAVAVDESSTSNQAFLNAVELSAGSTNDYLDNNSGGFSAPTFDVGDNAVTFPSERMTNGFKDLRDTTYTRSNIRGPTELYIQRLEVLGEVTFPIEQSTENNPIEEDPVQQENNEGVQCIEDSRDVPQEHSVAASHDSMDSIEKVAELQEKPVETEEDNRNTEMGGAGETEVVSEDELPVVEKPSIQDAENVSDDELPGPKPADLPADTEVVSEDELPSAKKETRKRKNDEEKDDYDPGSPTSESESANKKQAVVKSGESKPIPAEKRSSTDEKPKKTLPELDKYWKVVNDDPTDFTGWTYLLQYVDQESDVEAAREAYDAFLSHYPYCYGYWRKYADYEKRKGSKKKCLEVLERGLKAIPLSVDLWIHYLNHIKTTRSDDIPYVRSQYERAIDVCGLEFRSDRLWESYVKWEAEHGTPLLVTQVYDRLLATPTLGYTTHFDNFQEHIMSESVSAVVSSEELIRLRSEVRAAAAAPPPPLDLPPGEDEPPDHIASDEEAQAIKERIIATRRKVHKATGEEVAARWTFEEGIKRPYFHVKPLERCQLKNWKAYLEWERQHGSFKRALLLHERCLIACALYDDFWMRLVKFLEEHTEKDPSLIQLEREVLERACTVHHLDKPELHLYWAYFEETQGSVAKAAEILERIEKTCPNLVQIQYRRVNLERRRGDLDKCGQLYEHYISIAKSKPVASALAIKYARFLLHVRKDPAAARKVLDEAVTKDPLNSRLYMQRLDLALHTPDTPYSELEELVQAYEKQPGAEPEVCGMFAWRRRELAEELGDAAAAAAAHAHQRALHKHMRKRMRKERGADNTNSTAVPDAKKKDAPPPVTQPSNASSGSYYQAPSGATYDQQSYAAGYQPGAWGYQQPAGYGAPPHGWPQYPPNYY